ncbi:carbamoyltransferase C-terminal domain-containing protein [Streptomyces anulatus]
MSSGTKYYLSCYLSPPDTIESFSIRHDHAIALWEHGARTIKLRRYWEMERISGQKHHLWPLYSTRRVERVLTDLLAEEGLALDDISMTWGTPGLPRYREIVVPEGAEEYPMHSLSHLFSGLLMDTTIFKAEKIVALAVDGGPDRVLDKSKKQFRYAGCVSDRGVVRYMSMDSPGNLYSECRNVFAKEEGTLMALASATRTAIEYDVESAVTGIDLSGVHRRPSEDSVAFVRDVVAAAERQLDPDSVADGFSFEENLQSAVMKCVQRACELIMERNIVRLCAMGGVEPGDCYLSISGGYALNCPSNSWILERFGFKDLLTPPCPDDSGQALGLGLLGLYGEGVLEKSEFKLSHAYHGSVIPPAEEALVDCSEWVESVTPFDPEVFLDDLANGPVAWVDGASEIGPRALGNRSLIADPRRMESKDLLNRYKRRQWWRPVAPMVMEEFFEDWFDASHKSPFMLKSVQVRSAVAKRVPAVLHEDGSARFQTVGRDSNPSLHSALAVFNEATGVPMLCNTSLNDKGEPIVDSVDDAITFCARRGVEVAYINGRRVAVRADVDGMLDPGARKSSYFTGQAVVRDEIWDKWIAAGTSVAGLYMRANAPGLRGFDRSEKSVRYINRLAAIQGRQEHFGRAVKKFEEMFGPGSDFRLGARWEL